MRKILTIAALALFLGCGSAFQHTDTVRGTGSHDTGRENIRKYAWTLQVDNSNWKNAKIYLIPSYSGSGRRVMNINGMTRGSVTLSPQASTFRVRVEFLASSETWTSQTWSPDEPCLKLDIRSYVDLTNVIPCWNRG